MAPRTPIKIPTQAEPVAGVGVPSERPMPLVRRPAPVTNALLLGQQLADALLAARALINRTATDPAVTVEGLRGWYYGHDPAHRDRLVWRHFEEAKQTHAQLEQAVHIARETLDVERRALGQAQAEHEALATHPLPATIEQEASGIRADGVRRYQSVGIECQQRAAAIAELERLLPAPEQALGPPAEAVTRGLQAVVTIDREALVRRVGESGELEHLRSRFERLRTMASTHDAAVAEWSKRANRSLRIPRVDFPWPAPTVWKTLVDTPVEDPKLVWSDDPNSPEA